MKTKMLLFAVLIGFMFASCQDDEPKFSYEFTVTKIITSIPLSNNLPKVSTRTFIETNITESESNYTVMAYSIELSETINDTLFVSTVCCTKKRL